MKKPPLSSTKPTALTIFKDCLELKHRKIKNKKTKLFKHKYGIVLARTKDHINYKDIFFSKKKIKLLKNIKGRFTVILNKVKCTYSKAKNICEKNGLKYISCNPVTYSFIQT